VSAQAATEERWWHLAACRGKPQRFWFADGGSFEARVARAVCSSCPVRAPCLAAALAEESDEVAPSGIRGGLTDAQRVKLRRL
jgi:Transcription factor WhiB